ncbi:hypothetical protein [Actinoplanes sp. NPDC051494]|uniref:hypothetical protein n=1 Tax=Actinoplanes sp. NPDC051494 TaxID=3363907 RepID=UPI0037BA2D7B
MQVFPEAAIWADPSVITGTKNIGTDWDSWVQGLDGIGMKRYLELNQQAYDRYKTGK